MENRMGQWLIALGLIEDAHFTYYLVGHIETVEARKIARLLF